MIVSVEELKTHLRIQQDEEDEYIEGLIKQAQEYAESYCRVSFEQTTTNDEDEEVPVPVPEPVRLAVMLMASFYYENREIGDTASWNATRRAFQNLLYPFRDPDKMF